MLTAACCIELEFLQLTLKCHAHIPSFTPHHPSNAPPPLPRSPPSPPPCPLLQLPAGAAQQGVWTRTQLSDGFADVERVSRQLAWVPEGQGGFITTALAKLASKLKVGGLGVNWVSMACADPQHF